MASNVLSKARRGTDFGYYLNRVIAWKHRKQLGRHIVPGYESRKEWPSHGASNKVARAGPNHLPIRSRQITAQHNYFVDVLAAERAVRSDANDTTNSIGIGVKLKKSK